MTGARRQRFGIAAGVAFVFFLLAALYAWELGGFSQEFLSDGAIHYVTTLLTRDYLVHGVPGNPVAWLDGYYRHYPLAGFGLWPPLYYGVAGLWTILFGGSRESLVLFSAAVAGAGCAAVALASWRRLGPPAALLAGCFLLLMPTQASALRTLLLDPLCGLLCFLAALAFAHYLATRSARSLCPFVLAALAAVFTKGNALLLGLLPAFAIGFTRQWWALRDWRPWLAGAVIGAIAGPWYFFTAGLSAQGFRYAWGLPFFLEAVPANAALLFTGFGPIVLPLAIVGLVTRLRANDIWWRTLAALALSSFLFQSIVPAALNLRYLFAAFLPLTIFAAAGVLDIAAATARARIVAPALAAIAILSLALLGMRQPELDRLGIAPVAAAVAKTAPQASVVLVATSALVEAGAIAELAQADSFRPSLYAVRGSKLLGGGGYFATDYKPLFATTALANAAIQRLRPSFVIVEHSPQARTWRHVQQVEEIAAADPANWRPAGRFTGEQGREFRLYRLNNPHPSLKLARELNRNEALSALAPPAPSQQ